MPGGVAKIANANKCHVFGVLFRDWEAQEEETGGAIEGGIPCRMSKRAMVKAGRWIVACADSSKAGGASQPTGRLPISNVGTAGE